MRASIAQPAYLPWAGYFRRILESDIHISLDHVQFEKNSVINRNKIRTSSGWSWLTVPLKTSGRFGSLAIDSLEIDNSRGWAKKHWRSLQQSYGKSKFFARYGDFFESLYAKDWHLLTDLIAEINDFICAELNIEWQPIRSSSLNLTSKKSDLVLDLCRLVEADEYLSGPFGRDYLDVDSFRDNDIAVIYHDYEQPRYQQCHGNFIENMSIVDLLFNYGPNSEYILRE